MAKASDRQRRKKVKGKMAKASERQRRKKVKELFGAPPSIKIQPAPQSQSAQQQLQVTAWFNDPAGFGVFGWLEPMNHNNDQQAQVATGGARRGQATFTFPPPLNADNYLVHVTVGSGNPPYACDEAYVQLT
jgi:hypothetical protein